MSCLYTLHIGTFYEWIQTNAPNVRKWMAWRDTILKRLIRSQEQMMRQMVGVFRCHSGQLYFQVPSAERVGDSLGELSLEICSS